MTVKALGGTGSALNSWGRARGQRLRRAKSGVIRYETASRQQAHGAWRKEAHLFNVAGLVVGYGKDQRRRLAPVLSQGLHGDPDDAVDVVIYATASVTGLPGNLGHKAVSRSLKGAKLRKAVQKAGRKKK